MPANLTPEYHRAEAHLREAKTVDDKIAALEEMLRVIPKHKGTDHMQADLRARIAKLRKESVKQGKRGGFSRIVAREGAGQVALVGPPNSGKSLLVATLTHATPTVADYPFTTCEPTPGMMPFEDLQFQLVDLPPVSPAHVEPFVFDLVRHADLVWAVLDGRALLEGFDEVRRLLEARRIELLPGRGAGAATSDGWRTVRRALLVLTHADLDGVSGAIDAADDLLERRWPLVAVSAVTGAGLDRLGRLTFEALDLIRVYTKQPGKPADRDTPFALPRGATVGHLAERIHKDLLAQMRFARVWGPSAFDGQTVQRDHELAEGDVVEIHA